MPATDLQGIGTSKRVGKAGAWEELPSSGETDEEHVRALCPCRGTQVQGDRVQAGHRGCEEEMPLQQGPEGRPPPSACLSTLHSPREGCWNSSAKIVHETHLYQKLVLCFSEIPVYPAILCLIGQPLARGAPGPVSSGPRMGRFTADAQ